MPRQQMENLEEGEGWGVWGVVVVVVGRVGLLEVEEEGVGLLIFVLERRPCS